MYISKNLQYHMEFLICYFVTITAAQFVDKMFLLICEFFTTVHRFSHLIKFIKQQFSNKMNHKNHKVIIICIFEMFLL